MSPALPIRTRPTHGHPGNHSDPDPPLFECRRIYLQRTPAHRRIYLQRTRDSRHAHAQVTPVTPVTSTVPEDEDTPITSITPVTLATPNKPVTTTSSITTRKVQHRIHTSIHPKWTALRPWTWPGPPTAPGPELYIASRNRLAPLDLDLAWTALRPWT
jgi:hypothetical protein